jgi:hypothetical protein
VGFKWNFTEGTSKELDYLKSPYVYNFLMTTMKSIKKKEGSLIEKFSPRKKEESKSELAKTSLEQPNNGRELFFSNVLMKIYQTPSVFHRNSEEDIDDNLSSFIVLFYEKNMRKRTFAKSQT